MENKLSLKKVFMIAITLMIVAGLSGALIVCLNMFTEPRIKENEIKLEQKKLQEVYQDAEFIAIDYQDQTILKVSKAIKDDHTIGYVYKVSGKNAYGKITLLVGVNPNGTTKNVVFIENTESFASTVDEHLTTNYQKDGLDNSLIEGIDVKCGATYGAKLIKELVQTALKHFVDNYKEVE